LRYGPALHNCKDDKAVQLVSRNQNESDYAELLIGLKWLPADSLSVAGELAGFAGGRR
jgi:hypothetical protein